MKNFKQCLLIMTVGSLIWDITAHAAIPATKQYVDEKSQVLQTQIVNTPQGQNISAGPGFEIRNKIISSGHYVGEAYQGGVIIWVDTTLAPTLHGLVVDTNDLAGYYAWDNQTGVTTQATDKSYYSGKNTPGGNTFKILNQIGARGEAALACINSRSGGFNDWYLPSFNELYLLIASRAIIWNTITTKSLAGTQLSGTYWSSSESASNTAYGVVALTPGSGISITGPVTKTSLRNVRCVRAF